MSIKNKLFFISSLPSIIILIFSINHMDDKYQNLQEQKNLLVTTQIIKDTSALLHELQIERGLSSVYLQTKNDYFFNLIKKQKILTDKMKQLYFNTLTKMDKNILSKSTMQTKESTYHYLSLLDSIRLQIIKNKITASDTYNYFSYLNSKLIQFTQEIKLYSTNKEIYDEIMAFKSLIILNEISGQERALVAFIFDLSYSKEKKGKFYNILENQDKEFKKIKHFLDDTKFSYTLKKIQKKYSHSYLEKIRINLIHNTSKELNTKLWIKTTTNRINDFFLLEQEIFADIQKELEFNTRTSNFSLILQIIFTLLAIILFQIVSYLIAKNIKLSLTQLESGIDDFFDFLNFKIKEPKRIDTYSNDELNSMAKKINKQIIYIQLNLEDDKDFIKETTSVTQLMKRGDFSEQIYFEPANPNLAELKVVFNQLITLITNKIKQQTTSLERLNSSLQDKVYHQTIELEKQLVAVTISRDEALSAQKSKDDFLANMSHEIRTPLNAILGFVTILQKRVKNEKNIEYLNIINTSGNSLLAIINDILDFSKIQSGKFSITPREIDPMLELSNTTLLFASKVYEKHLIYSIYIDPKLPKSISVDDTRVKQILSNLLSNAIKFTPEDGMIEVSIFIQNNNLIISVKDSGIGIAKENLDKVFFAFEQADSSTTRKFGGTGLGLSISSKLASLMDGNLSVSSKESIGSTFTLSIPITITNSSIKYFLDLNKIAKYKFAILNHSQSDKIFAKLIKKYLLDLKITNVLELSEYQDYGYDILFFIPDDDYNDDIVESKIPAISMLRSTQIRLAQIPYITPLYAPFTPISIIQAIDDITIENIQELQQVPSDDKEAQEDEPTFSGKVLVAEDNKTNQMLIGLLLFDYEIEYKIANNGVEAVKMFKEDNYDLVLMDENMPELNGLGAMKQIKEYEKTNLLKNTPIVALTAAVLQSDVERFLSEGMDGFIAKPIDNKKLEFELDKYLKRN